MQQSYGKSHCHIATMALQGLRAVSEAPTTYPFFVGCSCAALQVYLAAGADGGYKKSGGEYFDNMSPGRFSQQKLLVMQ